MFNIGVMPDSVSILNSSSGFSISFISLATIGAAASFMVGTFVSRSLKLVNG